ncbi:MAG: TIGR03118 family protein [Acidobacteriia bacterium]|nr:TIGR03118 family protein [Terriglobia bacterium]
MFRIVVRLVGMSLAALLLLSATAGAQRYQQTNLVSDVPGLAATTDPDLVNAWGMVHSATSPWWVNDNGTGKSTLYDAAGTKQTLVVTVPPPDGSAPGTTSAPTGIVFNGSTTDFIVANPADNTKSGAARFIFATEDGTISGWNPTANPNTAIIEVDHSASAVYKSLAMGVFNGATLLYAANFTGGKVEVFDSSWAPASVPGGFVDAHLPPDYSPFNVQNIGGNIFVTFAKSDGSKDEVHGRGLGFVDEFDSGGNLLMRLKHGKWLNAPWGIALAPADFGKFSNHLLVGNFGSGMIAAYDPSSGEFDGLLRGRHERPIVIPGLWALAFGSGGSGLTNNGPANTLFFSAGIDDEEHGLFGTLTAVPRKDDDGKDRDDKDHDDSRDHDHSKDHDEY